MLGWWDKEIDWSRDRVFQRTNLGSDGDEGVRERMAQ